MSFGKRAPPAPNNESKQSSHHTSEDVLVAGFASLAAGFDALGAGFQAMSVQMTAANGEAERSMQRKLVDTLAKSTPPDFTSYRGGFGAAPKNHSRDFAPAVPQTSTDASYILVPNTVVDKEGRVRMGFGSKRINSQNLPNSANDSLEAAPPLATSSTEEAGKDPQDQETQKNKSSCDD